VYSGGNEEDRLVIGDEGKGDERERASLRGGGAAAATAPTEDDGPVSEAGKDAPVILFDQSKVIICLASLPFDSSTLLSLM
jgi:hypothetical protein